jgi:polyhydroxyalkanoate synthase
MVNIFKAMEAVSKIGQLPKTARTPAEIIYREDTLKVLHYLPTIEDIHPIPVFIVPSLINKYYILDLLPGKSYVEYLTAKGFAVYLIDWGVVDDTDRFLTLEKYLEVYLKKAVEKVLELEQAEQVSLIGYCMGGTMALIFAALFPETVRNLVLLATPVDFHNNSLLSIWAREEYFDVDKTVNIYGNIPVSVLQSAFQLLKPVKTFTRYVDLYENAENEDFVQTFLAFDYWANDAVPVAGETFRKFVKDTFQKNLLIKNQMTMSGKVVELNKLNSSILNVIALHDNIVPPESAEALMETVGSQDKEMLRVKGGHHGITIGSSALKTVWPHTANWLKQRP